METSMIDTVHHDNDFTLAIPEHMAQVIARFATERGLTTERATMKLLGTMCGLLKQQQQEVGSVLALKKSDGTVSEILF
jgi:hypothetical protein